MPFLPSKCVCIFSPWWDCLPRFVSTSYLQTAINYHANLAMNGIANDPGWGPWFTWAASDGFSGSVATRQSYDAAGIKSISYTKCFGSATAPIVSLGTGTPTPMTYDHWTWQYYNGTDPIEWSGCWTWFDDAAWARPYTRTGPTCSGSPMTYPDGTIATGFLNNNSTDPRNSLVYDAGCSADIFGNIGISAYNYNSACSGPGGVHNGLIYVPSTGLYCSDIDFKKDPACPCWADYGRALTYFGASQFGNEGTWCDNFTGYDGFACAPLVASFGKWPVAGFPTYLQNNFTVSQLISMGVLTSGQTYANLPTFDIRTYLKNKASSVYGWNGTDLSSSAWSSTGWLNDSVWNAYKIYKRQSGTTGITNSTIP